MKESCSGIILAGGLNRRFSGREKAFISVGGKRIMDRLHRLFKALFEDVIIVTNDPEKYLEWDAKIVTDLFPIRSSLTGIHAGLYYAQRPHAFVAACDTPFLSKSVVETVLAAISGDVDVVIPHTDAGLEPLCAAYSTRCLETIHHHLKVNKLKIQMILRKMRVRRVSERMLRRVDPQLYSFFNINAPSDLVEAEAIWSQMSKTTFNER